MEVRVELPFRQISGGIVDHGALESFRVVKHPTRVADSITLDFIQRSTFISTAEPWAEQFDIKVVFVRDLDCIPHTYNTSRRAKPISLV